MKREEFTAGVRERLPELVKQYHLAEWMIAVTVVKDDELPNGDVANAEILEPYRRCVIRYAAKTVRHTPPDELWEMLDHELQHLLLYPLDELLLTVKADLYGLEQVYPDSSDGLAVVRESLAMKFRDTNERLRSLIGRLTKRGNLWSVDAPDTKPDTKPDTVTG